MNHIKYIFKLIILLLYNNTIAQNSMVGDGFGGRLWYQPTNYTVGSYSGYSICYSGLCNNGTNQLYGWGSNNSGQLGYNHTALSGVTTPTPIPNMSNVKYYSTGYCMGAIKNDSSGWVWGTALSNTPTPVQIMTNAKFLDANIHSISFVKHDGTVWSVGSNYHGTYGDSTIISNYSWPPVPTKMLNITNAVRVATNEYVTIILLSNGTVKSVGYDYIFGLLGVGSNWTRSLTPVSIPTLSNIVDIKACTEGIIALDNNGDIYTWGNGDLIGDGDATYESVPKKITSLSNIVAISGCADGGHFMALDANKNCYAWGYGGGQFGTGYNTPTANLYPKLVATNVIDIMAGETFSYIVKADGTLWCSGFSYGGSIWLNLSDQQRDTFTLVNPALVPGACSVSYALANTTSACNTNNGSITVTQSSGQAPYSYSIGSGNQNSNIFTGLVAGNYTVTITDNNACVTTVTCAVASGSGSSPTLTVNSPTICSGTSALLTANGAANYAWSNSTTLNSASSSSVIANPTVTTIYTITGTSSNNCAGSITSTVTVIEKPIISASSNSICIGSSVVLNANAPGTYSWSPSNTLNTTIGNSVIATPTSNTTYTAQSTNSTCAYTSTQTIIIDKCANVLPEFEISIPNVFTPNGDLINDVFKITSKNLKALHCEIYNRWGMKLYEWDDINGYWDGKTKTGLAPDGTYFYIVNYTNNENETKTEKGFLSLFRD